MKIPFTTSSLENWNWQLSVRLTVTLFLTPASLDVMLIENVFGLVMLKM